MEFSAESRNLNRWLIEVIGKSGKPKLVYENHAMPVFYRDVMYREGAEGKDEAYLLRRIFQEHLC